MASGSAWRARRHSLATRASIGSSGSAQESLSSARLLARADVPVLAPEKSWEKTGQVPHVVFVEGMVRQGSKCLFYCGGAGQYVGVAEAALSGTEISKSH